MYESSLDGANQQRPTDNLKREGFIKNKILLYSEVLTIPK